MGLVNKLKNILFEEEEVEIPVLEKKEKTVIPVASERPRQEQIKPVQNYGDFYQEEVPTLPRRDIEEQPKPTPSVEKAPVAREEKPVYQKETSFNFPDFDEEEFESALPRRSTNVLEYERKKETKKKEYKAPVKKEEAHEVKTKFRPSPIISPVYGILDKNYTPDDITTRIDNELSRTLDVDSVRKKAFGTLELEDKFEASNVLPEPVQNDDQILEERLEKARTIDELLRDSSDDVIDIPEVEEEPVLETIDSLDEKKSIKEVSVEDDTLESDLFDLIDSMYENREDGE